MQGPTTPGSIETDHPLRRGFADNYGVDSPFHDEMVQADRSLRPHWQEFVSLLDEMKPGEFGHRRDLARRLIHQNGVTHNVYGDPNGLDRPWSLDFIPLLIRAAHWENVSEGLIQRARLLDRLLADLYGPADTVLAACFPRNCCGPIPVFFARVMGSGYRRAAGCICTRQTWCATRPGSSKF